MSDQPRRGLRRQWRAAFLVMGAALLLALAGVTATYIAVANGYRSTAHNLNAAISQTSRLDAAVNQHEIQSHKLWQGTKIDRTAYLRGERQISAQFAAGLRGLRGPGEHALMLEAVKVWRSVLTTRGLWGPSAGPRRGGVTAAMQAAYGSAQDQVYFLFGRLSETAIRDGGSDLASADSFQHVGFALLISAFALVIMIMAYFARRLTTDVLRPVEFLQIATKRLRSGALDHRLAVSGATHGNEMDELASAFNEMAASLDVSHDELARRAALDGLTGLPNRASFNEHLQSHFVPDERQAEPVSVLFIDVDDFKFVNDTIGHAAGDTLLVGVAKRLSSCVRPGDVVARLGGDEFAIIALGNAMDATTEIITERVLAAFTEPFAVGDQSVPVHVSIGVSSLRADTIDSASLLSEADFAMYTAKRAGTRRSEVFDGPTGAVPGSPVTGRVPSAPA
jgi:diguanylate cyclase (GGDEF)-like protein